MKLNHANSPMAEQASKKFPVSLLSCVSLEVGVTSHAQTRHRRIADVCFELHFRVTPGQFRPAAASSLHRRLALLATSTRPSFSKNAYLGILFAPMYQKYSLDFVSFGFYSNIQIV